jgi:hypothetical protein
MWRSPTGPGHRSFLSLVAGERAPPRSQAWARRRPHGCHSKYPFAFLVRFDEWVELGAVVGAKIDDPSGRLGCRHNALR